MMLMSGSKTAGCWTRVCGVGSYLPDNRVVNDDLPAHLDTSDEWIQRRTGIKARHIAAKDETTADMGAAAAKAALVNAGVPVEKIDLVIVATTTPDHIFPSTAARIQTLIGADPGIAFDVQAVCAGFIFALAQADNMLRLGQASCALVIGSECYSRILDWQDRGTCVLFGDGAGAVVLQAMNNAADSAISNPQKGIIGTRLCTDGRYYDLLYVDGGPGSTGTSGYVRMKGGEVFKHAVAKMSGIVTTLLADHQLKIEDIDWLVPHQANERIITAVGDHLSMPSDKVIVTVQDHANTSAATIPMALDRAQADGRLQPGHLLALSALGGGFAWGGALMRWQD